MRRQATLCAHFTTQQDAQLLPRKLSWTAIGTANRPKPSVLMVSQIIGDADMGRRMSA